MATYAATDLASKPRVMGEWGDLSGPEGSAIITAALVANDIVRPLVIPAGMEVSAIVLAHGDADTGTNLLVCDVGYNPVSAADGSLAPNQNYFKLGDTGFTAVSDGRLLANFAPIKFEQDVYLEIKCTTGANAMAANTTVRALVLGRLKGTK